MARSGYWTGLPMHYLFTPIPVGWGKEGGAPSPSTSLKGLQSQFLCSVFVPTGALPRSKGLPLRCSLHARLSHKPQAGR
jgi:hypothetical protein